MLFEDSLLRGAKAQGSTDVNSKSNGHSNGIGSCNNFQSTSSNYHSLPRRVSQPVGSNFHRHVQLNVQPAGSSNSNSNPNQWPVSIGPASKLGPDSWSCQEEWQIVEFFSRDWTTYYKALCERKVETLQLLLWDINHSFGETGLYGTGAAGSESIGFGRRAISVAQCSTMKSISDLENHLATMYYAYRRVMKLYGMDPDKPLVARGSSYLAIMDEFMYVEQWNRFHVHIATLYADFRCNIGNMPQTESGSVTLSSPIFCPTTSQDFGHQGDGGTGNEASIGSVALNTQAMESTFDVDRKGLPDLGLLEENDLTKMRPESVLQFIYGNENSNPHFTVDIGSPRKRANPGSSKPSISSPETIDPSVLLRNLSNVTVNSMREPTCEESGNQVKATRSSNPQISVTPLRGSNNDAAQVEYRRFVLGQFADGKSDMQERRRSSRVRHAFRNVFKRRSSSVRPAHDTLDLMEEEEEEVEGFETSSEAVPNQPPQVVANQTSNSMAFDNGEENLQLQQLFAAANISEDPFCGFSQGRSETVAVDHTTTNNGGDGVLPQDSNQDKAESGTSKQETYTTLHNKLDWIFEKVMSIDQRQGQILDSNACVEASIVEFDERLDAVMHSLYHSSEKS